MPNQSIAIIPGFAEGSWHTNHLHKALARYGYTKAADIRTADIVITHSAGCYFLPNTAENKLIILINPPYWPGRPVVVRAVHKLWGDFYGAVQRHVLGFWVRKYTWNWIYIGANIIRVVKIAHFASRRKFHEALRGKPVAIIRSDDDAWFAPDAEKTLPRGETFTFYRIEGRHEDCWLYPEKHARLIDGIIQEFLSSSR